MLPLLNSIYSKFTGDSTLTAAFPGGLHRDQAPEETAMPYLVSKVVLSNLEYSYGGPSRADTHVRFSAYGIGHDAVANLINTLTSQFDDVLLTLSSGVNDTVTRLCEPIPVLHHHDAQGNDVWEWSVVYEYGVRS
jgi:hypothetical protein